MGSTSISEIVEIKNNTDDTYFMYVWDNAHEGRYQPYNKPDAKWNYPEEGRWLKIGPRAHLRADDCGIPDGGKSGGKDRTRVIFKAKPGQLPGSGDPDRGLRVNRVGTGGDYDHLVFRDNATVKEVLSAKIPAIMHQSIILVIDVDGAQFVQSDMAMSGEAQAQRDAEIAGEIIKKAAEIFLTIMEFAAE